MDLEVVNLLFIHAPGEGAEEVYRVLKSAAASVSKRLGVSTNVYRTIETEAGEDFTAHAFDALEKSHLVICDISLNDENIMYQMGFAHAANRPTIIICHGSECPIEVAGVRVLQYKSDKSDLEHRLSSMLEVALENLEEFTMKNQPARSNNNVFISYSRTDSDCLNRLLVHLRPLEKAGFIDLWVDTKLQAGDDWRLEIQKALHSARVAILLVSADFLASDFVVENELPPLLAAAEGRGTKIVPVIIRSCRFTRDRNLSAFQAINNPASPLLMTGPEEQEAMFDKISELVESLLQK